MNQPKQCPVKCDACGEDTPTHVLIANYKVCSKCEEDLDINMEKLHERIKDSDTK